MSRVKQTDLFHLTRASRVGWLGSLDKKEQKELSKYKKKIFEQAKSKRDAWVMMCAG